MAFLRNLFKVKNSSSAPDPDGDNVENKPELAAADQSPEAVWGVRAELWDLLKVFLVSLAIVLPLRYFIVQPFIVRGESMIPNFQDSEYLIVDETSYYFRAPERGETIVFRYPRDPSQFYIKRIIGLPGETVEIKNGHVGIYNTANPDGLVLDENYLPAGRLTYPDERVSLGKDEFFVLGDNRGSSSDSRIWGVLGRQYIVGRAWFRAFPLTKIGFIPGYSYIH